jgi:hypothetical protein
VKLAFPPRGINLIVGRTFIAKKNELEVFPELVRAEEVCDSFEWVVAVWPFKDFDIAPPRTRAVDPRPSRRTIEMMNIVFFNYITKV